MNIDLTIISKTVFKSYVLRSFFSEPSHNLSACIVEQIPELWLKYWVEPESKYQTSGSREILSWFSFKKIKSETFKKLKLSLTPSPDPIPEMLAHLKVLLHQFNMKMDLRHLVIDSLSVNLSGGENKSFIHFSFLIGTSFQILKEAMKIRVSPILQRPLPPSPPIFNIILWIKNDPA